MSNATILDPTVLKHLEAVDDWGGVYQRLVLYAVRKTNNLSFIRGRGVLPLGRKPEDLAQEAFKRVFEGKRKWKPDQDPDICEYLMGVVDSLLSDLLDKADYRHQDGRSVGELAGLSSSDGVSYDDCVEALIRICEAASADDSDLDNVRQGLEDGMKAGEIADFFGIDVKEVYNLTRKLRRRIEREMKKHPCNDQWQLSRN